MMPIQQSSVRNHLLLALAPEDFIRLAPSLTRVDLPVHQILFGSGEVIEAVHFVEAGVVSIIVTLLDGDDIEVGTVGREGMVGLPLLLEDDTSPNEARVQLSGGALRLGAAPFREALRRSAALRQALLRYTLAYHGLATQALACKSRHSLEQRLACWLLLAHERTDGDDLPLTHESIATLLGVRRASVTVAAGHLQKGGLIRYERGRITVLNPRGLEAISCECHEASRNETDRLRHPFVCAAVAGDPGRPSGQAARGRH